MAKKPHKADLDALACIAASKTFAAMMFLGRGKYLCENYASIPDARSAVARMNAEHGARTGRRAWVTAIDPRGAGHLVSDNYGTTDI